MEYISWGIEKFAQILFAEVIRVSLKLLSAILRFLSHHTYILSNWIFLVSFSGTA